MSTYEPGSGGDPSGSSAGATGVQDRVKETTREATGQVQEKAQEVKGEARERASTQLDQRTTDAGEQMRTVADALRRTGGNLREEGQDQPAKVVQGLADRVERLGGYLTETSGDGLMRDVEDFGRRRPWAIAGIGAVLGLAGSRFLKASSASRQQSGRSVEQRYGSTASPRPGYVPTPAEPTLPPVTGAPVGTPTGGPLTTPGVTTPPSDPASPSGI